MRRPDLVKTSFEDTFWSLPMPRAVVDQVAITAAFDGISGDAAAVTRNSPRTRQERVVAPSVLRRSLDVIIMMTSQIANYSLMHHHPCERCNEP